MSEIATYLEAVKERFDLSSDYALAEKLGIAQPDANLMRRGLKVPKPELCIKIAKLLNKNPVELLLIAQKDKAPSSAKEYWTLALTAIDVMLHVPKTPKYIPRKVEAIGRELRSLETQTLTYEGAEASAEAVRLVQTAEHSIDAIMERWNIWKKGEALYPNYLMANQEAAKRGVTIRRLLVLTREQMQQESAVADAVQVMEDQHRAGINIFYAFREELERAPAFQRHGRMDAGAANPTDARDADVCAPVQVSAARSAHLAARVAGRRPVRHRLDHWCRRARALCLIRR